jgi:hypothetical protein
MIRLTGVATAVTIGLGIIGLAHEPCAQAAPLTAQDDAHRQWHEFRKTVTAHSQVIAVTQPYPDGSRLIVLAEPSPTLDNDAIKRDLGSINANVFTARSSIGVDGWVQDKLLVVPRVADWQLANTLARLSFDAYGTTYQSIPVALPLTKATSPLGAPLDLSISASELNNWLLSNPQQTFYSVLSPTPHTLGDLLRAKNYGDYVSRTPGLAILVLPRGTDIDRFRIDIARFTRESDVILGAIATSDTVAVVARQRVADFVQMPPLRVETILQLASAKTDELAQSYDRNHILAGRVEGKEGYDWAPIYLSDLLIDTEYGSLLNLADQILKSWSNAGHTKYVNFDYRNTTHWVFPDGLDQMITAKTDSIRYNWNTKGDYYRIKFDGAEILALVRTGALPITYDVPRRDMRKEEDLAFDWFARQNDPILARVVQYTTIYEIFHTYDVRSNTVISRHTHPERSQLLQKLAGELIDSIKQIPPGKLAAAPEEIRKAAQAVQSDLAFGQNIWGPRAQEMLAAFLGDPRSYTTGDGPLSDSQLADQAFLEGLKGAARETALLEWAAKVGNNWTRDPEKREFLADVNDSGSDAVMMVDASRNATADSIKTPWVVVSSNWNHKLTGGHSIGTAMPRFEFSPSAAKGAPESEHGIIMINPADADVVPKLSRSILRDQTDAQLGESVQQALRSTERVSQRTETVALQSDAQGLHWQTNPAAAGFSTDGAPRTAMWAEPTDPQRLAWVTALAEPDMPTYLVERSSDGFVMVGTGGQSIELPTLPNLQELLSSIYAKGIDHPPPAKILFHGFQEGQVDAVLRSTRLRYAAGRPPGDASVFLVGREDLSPQEIAQQLHWQYKWDKAIVDRSSIAVRKVNSGPLAGLHEVSLEARIVPLGRPPFLIRIILYFSDAVPEFLQKQIMAVVDRFIATDASQFTELDGLITHLHLKLATEFPQADPKLHVKFDARPRDHEAADISISDARTAGSPEQG